MVEGLGAGIGMSVWQNHLRVFGLTITALPLLQTHTPKPPRPIVRTRLKLAEAMMLLNKGSKSLRGYLFSQGMRSSWLGFGTSVEPLEDLSKMFWESALKPSTRMEEMKVMVRTVMKGMVCLREGFVVGGVSGCRVRG